jgi:predicted RNase H-like HicB family nuclease
MNITYAVVIEQAGANYSAYVPDLPGCVASAGSREGVLAEIRSAIQFHLEGLAADGQPVPISRNSVAMVSV